MATLGAWFLFHNLGGGGGFATAANISQHTALPMTEQGPPARKCPQWGHPGEQGSEVQKAGCSSTCVCTGGTREPAARARRVCSALGAPWQGWGDPCTPGELCRGVRALTNSPATGTWDRTSLRWTACVPPTPPPPAALPYLPGQTFCHTKPRGWAGLDRCLSGCRVHTRQRSSNRSVNRGCDGS